jgi:hypothetical protein
MESGGEAGQALLAEKTSLLSARNLPVKGLKIPS